MKICSINLDKGVFKTIYYWNLSSQSKPFSPLCREWLLPNVGFLWCSANFYVNFSKESGAEKHISQNFSWTFFFNTLHHLKQIKGGTAIMWGGWKFQVISVMRYHRQSKSFFHLLFSVMIYFRQRKFLLNMHTFFWWFANSVYVSCEIYKNYNCSKSFCGHVECNFDKVSRNSSLKNRKKFTKFLENAVDFSGNYFKLD